MPGSGFGGAAASFSVERSGFARLAARLSASSILVARCVALTALRSSPRLVVYPWRISAASLKAMTMPESESVAASISLIASA